MRGFAVDIEIERAVRVMNDVDVKHRNPAVLFDFYCPFYVWVYGVDVGVKWANVVVVDGCDGVVGFPVPEEYDVTGRDYAACTTVKLSS